MYEFALFVHSWLRWVITILLLISFVLAVKGWVQKTPYFKKHRILGGVLVGFVHLQLLIGLLLYFSLSPITQAAMSNMGATMHNATLRYWTIEHVFGMIVFAVFVQIGQSTSKRVIGDLKKHKRMAIFTGIAILILFAMMPWPWRKEIGRPLFITSAEHQNK